MSEEKIKNKQYPLSEVQLIALYNHKFDPKNHEVVREMILIFYRGTI